MSIRFHKGPAIITLFHDATSPVSKQVLQLLTSQSIRRTLPEGGATRTVHLGSHGDSCVVEANGGGVGGGAMEYLRQAASDPPTSPSFQLEVVDRTANPPTPDQLRSIIDYLATPQPADAKVERAPRYTTSGFDLAEHERRKKVLAQHMAKNQAANGMPRIKEGPIVVNWDEGIAATSVEGVQQMLARLNHEKQPDAQQQPSGCTIA